MVDEDLLIFSSEENKKTQNEIKESKSSEIDEENKNNDEEIEGEKEENNKEKEDKENNKEEDKEIEKEDNNEKIGNKDEEIKNEDNKKEKEKEDGDEEKRNNEEESKDNKEEDKEIENNEEELKENKEEDKETENADDKEEESKDNKEEDEEKGNKEEKPKEKTDEEKSKENNKEEIGNKNKSELNNKKENVDEDNSGADKNSVNSHISKESKPPSVVEESNNELDDFFTDYLDKESIFVNKKVLQVKYLPNQILHRKNQVKQLASILAPALRKDKPSNLFVYGKTGTGKTLCVLHILNKINNVCERKNIPLQTIYLNCKLRKIADTEYRIIAQLARKVGESVPMTGLPTDEIYNIFINKIEQKEQVLIIVLDEVDQIIKKTGDEILYTLTRINSELENSQVAFIGVSNDVRFMENVDPRVKSSLGEEDLVFPPYNAFELKDILSKRSESAFKGDVLEGGVLAKCAAYAAREHGDARRALDLLRVSAEVAERRNSDKIKQEHIDMAEDKIERSRIIEITKTQPRQSQLVMYSIINIMESKRKNEFVETGEVFDRYKSFCRKTANHILTQRRISDLISELDMLGLINAKLISKGRYGRTREIYLTIPQDIIDKIKTILEAELL